MEPAVYRETAVGKVARRAPDEIEFMRLVAPECDQTVVRRLDLADVADCRVARRIRPRTIHDKAPALERLRLTMEVVHISQVAARCFLFVVAGVSVELEEVSVVACSELDFETTDLERSYPQVPHDMRKMDLQA